MGALDRLDRLLRVATLERSRRLVSSRGGRAMAVFFGLAYALIALLEGQMLVLAPNRGSHYVLLLSSNGSGTEAWNYPAVIVSEGWGTLTLPFFSSISMVVVSAGVGLGMSVAVLLALGLRRDQQAAARQGTAVGGLVGLSPALLALVTLGACCSTTAAATAGLDVIARTGGSTPGALLATSWVLGAFQMLALWIALVAQEELLRAYGLLRGSVEPAEAAPVRSTAASPSIGLLRLLLALGGGALALSTLLDWASVNPLSASPATWTQWLLLQELVGITALGLALFPVGTLRLALARTRSSVALRSVVLLGSAVLLGWTPAFLAASGLHGLGNELLGAFGFPPATGAVVPAAPLGLDLLLRWLLVLGLPGAIGLFYGLAPQRLSYLLRADSRAAGAAGGALDTRPRDPEGARPGGSAVTVPASAMGSEGRGRPG